VSARGSGLTLGLVLVATSAVAGEAHFAVEGHAGYLDLSRAKKSAQAVFDGSSGGGTFGGGLRYAFGSGFYVSAWARTFSKEGERVFVADSTGEVFPLGHPLEVRIVPLQLTLGYRLRLGTLVVPYVGAGGGVTRYREESTVAGVVETNEANKSSWHFLAGVEAGSGTFRIAGEFGYLFVPDTVGLGGVSKVYGEKDVGGVWVVGKLILAF
jgi:hypothetical protein